MLGIRLVRDHFVRIIHTLPTMLTDLLRDAAVGAEKKPKDYVTKRILYCTL